MNKKFGLILNKKKDDVAFIKTRRTTIFDEETLENDEDEQQMEIISKCNKQPAKVTLGPTKPDFLNNCVFKEFDSDSNNESNDDKKTIGKQNQYASNKSSKDAKLFVQKALEEDPNVFAYDELYEEIQNKRDQTKEKNLQKTKSRYVEGMMRNLELRKIEEQRRLDRKIEKERQAEGDEFNDKEAFVTEAYKQKLMERKIYDEKERIEAEIEERMDVRKQGDMRLFYSHQLKQKVGEEKIKESTQEMLLKKITENLNKEEKLEQSKFIDKNQKEKNPVFKKGLDQSKQKRKLKSNEEDDEDDKDEEKIIEVKKTELSKTQIKEIAKYSEKNFTSSVDSSEDKKFYRISNQNEPEKKISIENSESDEDQTDVNLKNQLDDEKTIEHQTDQKIDESKELKRPRLNLREILSGLFEKKCVGDAFLEQQKNYFERLAARKGTI